ncbi:uncharacterized protein EV420DRAFT_1764068 [Desarmillaria tabescens]|uniref:Uncharacterized protein n=1 Tax=Armillaria tabescens TaxID=1929756 RepID=A0AA39N5P0_ARMTA|nr:uncharacterized protein EV420DRAFT_1764068 [Desarmillaria tabescens]KAK0458388.1 hypothetical protein EV420DRAFT_1764068 [Desarmillaria tabescens]
MSSIVLPASRRQCIQVTGNLQHCQCLWFFPPESPLLDQNICGHCGHGIHSHVDYVSMFVYHCPAMNCAAYFPKTSRVQACTCSASLIEHIPIWNAHRSSTPLSYGVDVGNSPPSNANTFTGDATNIPFTPIPMPSPSTNANPSYSYGNTVILAPTPQPITQMAITQIDAYSHSQVENSYIAQYQDDNFRADVLDSSAISDQDYSIVSYSAAHGTET